MSTTLLPVTTWIAQVRAIKCIDYKRLVSNAAFIHFMFKRELFVSFQKYVSRSVFPLLFKERSLLLE